ncbi:hypothetical protein RhiirA4_467273 [Rhizophagus irregularis]|uniref:Uncharacterized protein n=1 Tax=Rhizophagus irregularis TaxID=588596 RepID=A0A2I1GVL9_9GLOM|nr:hypothetical protein RhiirA4_467273 [Rhizophagus irregularis]
MEQEKIIVVIQLTYQVVIIPKHKSEITKTRDAAYLPFNTSTDILLLKPPYKQVENIYKVANNPTDGTREFCDILVGSGGINSPVTQFDADVAAPKNLMNRLIKLCGNAIFQGCYMDYISFNSDRTRTRTKL